MGLQARVECRDLPEDEVVGGRWLLAANGAALAERERALVEASIPLATPFAPGKALATAMVRQMAPRGIEHGAQASALATAVLMAGAGLLAVAGYAAAGLAIAAIAAFAVALAEALLQLRQGLWLDEPRGRFAPLLQPAGDCAAATVLALAYADGAVAIPLLALPLLALGLAHRIGAVDGGRAAQFWRDRTLHLAIFALAASSGFLGEAIALFGLGALAQLLLRPRRG
jgi:hypothetical protein